MKFKIIAVLGLFTGLSMAADPFTYGNGATEPITTPRGHVSAFHSPPPPTLQPPRSTLADPHHGYDLGEEEPVIIPTPRDVRADSPVLPGDIKALEQKIDRLVDVFETVTAQNTELSDKLTAIQTVLPPGFEQTLADAISEKVKVGADLKKAIEESFETVLKKNGKLSREEQKALLLALSKPALKEVLKEHPAVWGYLENVAPGVKKVLSSDSKIYKEMILEEGFGQLSHEDQNTARHLRDVYNSKIRWKNRLKKPYDLLETSASPFFSKAAAIFAGVAGPLFGMVSQIVAGNSAEEEKSVLEKIWEIPSGKQGWLAASAFWTVITLPTVYLICKKGIKGWLLDRHCNNSIESLLALEKKCGVEIIDEATYLQNLGYGTMGPVSPTNALTGDPSASSSQPLSPHTPTNTPSGLGIV